MTDTDTRRAALDAYQRRLLRIEQAAVVAVTVHYLALLAGLHRQATGRMLLAQTDTERANAARVLARDLGSLEQLLEPRQLLAAVEREARQAIDLAAGANGGTGVRLPLEPEIQRAMRSAIDSAQAQLTRAVGTLETATTPMQAETALTQAKGVAGHLATGAEYAVNSAANSAPKRIAIARGQKLVWVAERDACVVCLALSGDVVDPFDGEAFDEEATFGKPGSAPIVWPPGMPLSSPPRHPHCRCVIQVWNGSVIGGFLSWPERLKHEALRSVARGWSLPSESNVARLRAAERILRDGRAGQLPKSVQAEAERAVGTGRFTRRDVPHYHPVRTNVR